MIIDAHQHLFRIFEDATPLGNDEEPPITLEDGRHSVRIVDSIYRSVKEKRVIQVRE